MAKSQKTLIPFFTREEILRDKNAVELGAGLIFIPGSVEGLGYLYTVKDAKKGRYILATTVMRTQLTEILAVMSKEGE